MREMDKQVNKEVDSSTSRHRYVLQRQHQRGAWRVMGGIVGGPEDRGIWEEVAFIKS